MLNFKKELSVTLALSHSCYPSLSQCLLVFFSMNLTMCLWHSLLILYHSLSLPTPHVNLSPSHSLSYSLSSLSLSLSHSLPFYFLFPSLLSHSIYFPPFLHLYLNFFLSLALPLSWYLPLLVYPNISLSHSLNGSLTQSLFSISLSKSLPLSLSSSHSHSHSHYLSLSPLSHYQYFFPFLSPSSSFAFPISHVLSLRFSLFLPLILHVPLSLLLSLDIHPRPPSLSAPFSLSLSILPSLPFLLFLS